LVGNPEGNGSLRRNRHRWEGNITMDLKEIWSQGNDWIHLAQGRVQWWALMNTVMNLQVPWKA
jgi:hypothetical protein